MNYLLLILIIQSCSSSFCEFHPLNPVGCIETFEYSCYFDYKDGACSALRSTNNGCKINLNKLSCLQQITNPLNEGVLCIFDKRCNPISAQILSQKGCDEDFNRNACLQITKEQCYWDDNTFSCQKLENLDYTKDSCEEIVSLSVTPNVCSSLQYKCKNSGINGDYKCQTILEDELKTMKCSQLGLSESGCVSILTEGENCVFYQGQCHPIMEIKITNCEMLFNRNGCLSINDPNLKCQWKQNKCQEYQFLNQIDCLEITEVNSSVCQNSQIICRYDDENKRCIGFSKTQASQFTCNQVGLSREGCFAVNTQGCTFRNGICQEVSTDDLNIFHCEMELNEFACVNIKTEFQYCQWDGNKCYRKAINQQTNCIQDPSISVNGNFCQAISNLTEGCKYNQSTFKCMLSSVDDLCETPYINLQGCISISKAQETCQWQINGCRKIQIKSKVTTCSSLQFANALSCSQIYEDDSLGCYFDKEKGQCIPLQILLQDSEQDFDIIQQYRKSQQILSSLQCDNQSQGINQSTCASITTEGYACRWYQQQCQYIKNSSSIQRIPCQLLQYSNYRTCALVEFQKETCRYSQKVRGCVNTIFKDMTCEEIGLNQFACGLAKGACFFSQEAKRCFSLNLDDSGSVSQLEEFGCVLSSPTRPICLSILTKGQLCQWLTSVGKCGEVTVLRNDPCTKFSSANLLFNQNVCSAIVMDNPDFQNLGYCKYQKETNTCVLKLEGCKTKCCTEVQGINTHSCSKYSSQIYGDYCHFSENRCVELNKEIVNINDPSAVAEYYNSNQFTCEQLNKNSCWMLTWSVSQKCGFTGTSCLNVNLSKYNNFEIFTKAPTLVNENLCLAIEATTSLGAKQKYFVYDPINKLCNPQVIQTSFAKCEDAKGNRNICLRYTEYSYCKWDSANLKCVTIPQFEFADIRTCNYNQNIKACRENTKVACQFSFDNDRCIVAPKNVNCNYFDKSGPVSQLACRSISKSDQSCEFDSNYFKCKVRSAQFQDCNVGTANINACFKLTKGDCRWDSTTQTCYENKQQTQELKCLDNLNQQLCVKVVKAGEACIWNSDVGQCQQMTEMSAQSFQLLNSKNQYNEQACLMITGDGYQYDYSQKTCVKITVDSLSCNQFLMNQYACLYFTKGSNCYFDISVVPNKCKYFTEKQSICSSNYLINIDVCMNIKKQCYFDINTLKCMNAQIDLSTTCSNLKNKLSKGIIHNRLSCASIDPGIKDSFGDKQCYDNQEFGQQCNFEKYCYFNFETYSCEVMTTLIYYFDTQWMVCVNNEIKECYKSSNQFDTPQCQYTIKTINGYYLQDAAQTILPGRCSKTNTPCQSDNDCPKYCQKNAQMDQNGKITVCTQSSQTCEKICVIKGKYDNICQTDSDCGGQFVNSNYTPSSQPCQFWGCSKTMVNCSRSSDCPAIYINSTTSQSQNCNIYTCNYNSGCNCNYSTSLSCFTNADCPNYFSSYANPQYKQCKFREICRRQPKCLFAIKKIDKCSQNYSQAICLELVAEQCYFDINQGGCFQVKGNEHKIPSCDSINNNCLISQNSKTICQNGDVIQQPGNSCISQQIKITLCEPLKLYNPPFKCADIQPAHVQPSLCALASDDCVYSNGKCQSYASKCDKSCSKTLCQKQGWNYDYGGYCQEKADPIPLDNYNEYSQCYQVNMLQKNIQQNCARVQQACKFRIECEDASNMKCDDLINYYVSEAACINCKEYAVQYSGYQCYTLSNIVNSCDKLNRVACLQNTQGKKCKWESNKCTEVNSFTNECELYNFDSCNQISQCWFDTQIKQCINYDPLKGNCDQFFNKTVCLQSLKQSCQWQNNQCVQNKTNFDTCSNLNKYACLIQSTKPCRWLDTDDQLVCQDYNSYQYYCEFDSNPNYLYNKNVCKQIVEKVTCFQNKYFKCQKSIVTDDINCNTVGLNNYGCLNSTQQKCQFTNQQCQQVVKPINDCLTDFNKIACLNSSAVCIFKDSCGPYNEKNYDRIMYDQNYSTPSCYLFDQDEKFTKSLIYSQSSYQCIDVSSYQPFLYDCSFPGINKYACLTKTLVPCIFDKGICKPIDRNQLTRPICISTLNAYGCMQVVGKCKFENYQCSQITETDTCAKLIQNQSIVNPLICAQTTDIACKYNDTTKTCQRAESREKCETLGINLKGCIENTSGKFCKYVKNSCKPSYESVTCGETVNIDKCLQIRTTSNFCTFNSRCKFIQELTNPYDLLYKCIKPILTNPLTCSLANDIPCIYDIKSRTCIKFEVPYNSNDVNQNFEWATNSISLNYLACVIFNIDNKKTYWNNGCQLATDLQLNQLKCKDYVNLYTCINIQTPYQYCIYKNNQCKFQEIDEYNENCALITNINKGDFCVTATDVACMYNPLQHQCMQVPDQEDIICVDYQPESLGYNEKACNKSPKSCIFIQQCVKYNPSAFYYCNNAKSLDNCKSVINQGCQYTNQCIAIERDQYQFLKCEDAINLKACILISTKNQYCRFNQNVCQSVNLEDMKYQTCDSIRNINNLQICEYPQDVTCRFKPQTSSCTPVTSYDEQFTCQRGLNKLACLTKTRSYYYCKFFKYCYEYRMKSCSISDYCRCAYTIDQCLLQSTHKCQWIGNQCQQYENSSQIQCNQLQSVSRLICYEQPNTCIFDINQYRCQEILPQNCQDVQNPKQCTQIQNIACYWDQVEEECKQKITENSDTCQGITNISGSQVACMNVSKEGQLCIFKDFQCQGFSSDLSQLQNCQNNINRISCLHQISLECFWNVIVTEKQNYGECQQFQQENASSCSENLSYLSCLNIIKEGLRCIWINKSCSEMKISNTKTYTIYHLVQISQNVCSIINNGDVSIYDNNNKICQIIKDVDTLSSLSCSSPPGGLNKAGCLQIKTEPCKWYKSEYICKSFLQQENNAKRQTIPFTSCLIEDVNDKTCSLIELYLPCGATDNGCDKINLDNVDCDYPGLNKFSCLNITKHPCKWTKDEQGDLYHCEKYEPQGLCESQPQLVNPYVCSIILNEPCVYDQKYYSCIKPTQNYLNCIIEGANGIACSMYENCIFLNGICQKYDKFMKLECGQANKANFKVCKQILIDRCKYDILNYGCINTSLTDQCSSLGINQVGCSTLDDCLWLNNECICKKMQEKYPKCNEITNFYQCKNNDLCYFQVPELSTTINSTTLEIHNEGKCLDRTCDYYKQDCDGKLITDKLCYLNNEGKCKEAVKCSDILNPIRDCSYYKFQRPCHNKNHKLGIICEVLDKCENLNKATCLIEQYSELCTFTTSCSTKVCKHYHEGSKCINSQCNWNQQSLTYAISNVSKDQFQYNFTGQILSKFTNYLTKHFNLVIHIYNTTLINLNPPLITYFCEEQKACTSITNVNDCQNSQYNGKQCGWIEYQDQQYCTDIPCRYLKQTFKICVGAKIGKDVCVQLSDLSCVSCEEIEDPCICLKYDGYCNYNRSNSKCESAPCSNYNKDNCPSSHCYFEERQDNCASLCYLNYHKNQCHQQKYCIWNPDQNVCDPLNSTIKEKPDPLKSNDYSNRLVIKAVIIFLMIF